MVVWLGYRLGLYPDRKYDIFAGAVVAYAEVDLGMVRPFVGFVYGSGDGVRATASCTAS